MTAIDWACDDVDAVDEVEGRATDGRIMSLLFSADGDGWSCVVDLTWCLS